MPERRIKIPDLLWKYRRWNENTRSLLVDGDLYFSRVQDLNDPFEFRWKIDFPTNPVEQETFVRELCAKHFPHDSIAERRIHYANLMESLKQTVNNASSSRTQANTNLKVGVFCAAEPNDNILMWSHYGDEHKGVCLGISPRALNRRILPVEYVDEFPEVDAWFYATTPEQFFVALSLVKAKDWSYEREWRTIAKPGVHRVDKCVEYVVIGARATDDVIDDVKQAVSEAKHEIKLSRATLSDFRYGLDISPL